MKQVKNIATATLTAVILWILASLFDVNVHNVDGYGYAPWNVFTMVDSVSQAKQMSVKQQVKKPGKLYTEENIMLLAKLIEAENGSAMHDETLVLTGVCVLKRVKSKSFPNTIEGVIYQEGKRGRAYSTAPGLDGITPSERAMEIAEELLIYGVDEYPDSLVYQSMFPQGTRTYKKIDGEYFCLE